MEAHRAILQQAVKDTGVVILSLLEVTNNLCIVLEAQLGGFSFWSDRVNLPENGTFVLDGKTGTVVRGGKSIKKVTADHRLDALLWPSDDPHRAHTPFCAVYIDPAKVRSARRELHKFVLAGLGEGGRCIVVVDYPTS